MKKLPYGISNYEELIEDGYYYVDKTQYIEKLENLPEKKIMFLRPRKFGKTLFTSTLENYYDIKRADKFEKLFGSTYIGKHQTSLKNSYHILKFNFSGIDTSSEETTMYGFKERVAASINFFAQRYGLDFFVNTVCRKIVRKWKNFVFGTGLTAKFFSFWGHISKEDTFLDAGDTPFCPSTWTKGTDRCVPKVQERGRKGVSPVSKYYESITEI